MPTSNIPLQLTDDALLAMGGGRMIFAHPNRSDVVIKVPRATRPKRGLRRLFSRSGAFGPLWNSHVEIREFTRSVSAVGRVTHIYAQFTGFVQTNRGVGAMFEAIHTPDGALAPNLKHHAERHGFEPEMEQAIRTLWAEVKDKWLIISDCALANVVVTGDATTGYGLVIVDGIGDRVLIPVQNRFRSIHLKKAERQLADVLRAYRNVTGTPDLTAN